VWNVCQGSERTSYSTALLCACQYSDCDAFKYRVKLGANKLETDAGSLYQSKEALETNLVKVKGCGGPPISISATAPQ